MARHLKAHEIIQVAGELQARISARFPDSGLSNACHELVEVAGATADRVRVTQGPNVLLRLLLFAVIAGFVYGMYLVGRDLDVEDWVSLLSGRGVEEVPQALDAIVNLVILAGGGVWFLLSLEGRLKRSIVLRHLHELRSIAHAVDMTQLSIDPPAILDTVPPSPSSATRLWPSPPDLFAFLAFCTDMLALTGKLAALYAQRSSDPVINAAANDIEQLSAGLAGKIWQKITMIVGSNTTAGGRE